MRAALVAGTLLVAIAARAADGTRTYAFDAFLDGRPIGTHTFTIATAGDARQVTSEADFNVKILGVSVYRYRHHAEEQWSGDCLAALVSHTDDDGKASRVTLARSGERSEITTDAGSRPEAGCLMTYAYWNPSMRAQTRLLDPQTGEVHAVKVQRWASGRIAVGGIDVAATDWRITGTESPIDVWISDQGEWIGLDSAVSHGKHRLTYRLR